VALLALIGNMVVKEATASVSEEGIGFTLLIFVAGIAASTFASGGAYFTNYLNLPQGPVEIGITNIHTFTIRAAAESVHGLEFCSIY
jgi:hypothetical protein